MINIDGYEFASKAMDELGRMNTAEVHGGSWNNNPRNVIIRKCPREIPSTRARLTRRSI